MVLTSVGFLGRGVSVSSVATGELTSTFIASGVFFCLSIEFVFEAHFIKRMVSCSAVCGQSATLSVAAFLLIFPLEGDFCPAA